MCSLQNHKQQYGRTLCYVPFVACRFPSVLLCYEALLHSLRLRQLPANRARKKSRCVRHQTCHGFGRASINKLSYLTAASGSDQMPYCIAAQEKAEKTAEGCNMLLCPVGYQLPMSARMDNGLALPSKPKTKHRMPGQTRQEEAWIRGKLANITD